VRKLMNLEAAVVAVLVVILFPCLAHAAGGAPATLLQNVADTRDMAPGFGKFIADTYNGNLWVFGLWVVGIMAAMGGILGIVVDKLLSLTGIGLGKMSHHE
jgi:hypothetical protein